MTNVFKPPKLYRSPGGWLFHTDPDCHLLTENHVISCSYQDAIDLKLFPCPCTINSRNKEYNVHEKDNMEFATLVQENCS